MKIVNWGFIESVHEYRGENFQWIFWIQELVDFWENKNSDHDAGSWNMVIFIDEG